jgi:salicylate hydroxylase
MFVINGVNGKLYWAYSLTDAASEGRAQVRSKNLEEAKARVRQEFQGMDMALQILEATDPELILERRVLDMPVLTSWTKGRIVILGDAAHAVTPALGQGANLAFEDGLELALQLSSAPTLSCALEAYEQCRIPRAQIVSARTEAKGAAHPQSFYDWLYNEIPSKELQQS